MGEDEEISSSGSSSKEAFLALFLPFLEKEQIVGRREPPVESSDPFFSKSSGNHSYFFWLLSKHPFRVRPASLELIGIEGSSSLRGGLVRVSNYKARRLRQKGVSASKQAVKTAARGRFDSQTQIDENERAGSPTTQAFKTFATSANLRGKLSLPTSKSLLLKAPLPILKGSRDLFG